MTVVATIILAAGYFRFDVGPAESENFSMNPLRVAIPGLLPAAIAAAIAWVKPGSKP